MGHLLSRQGTQGGLSTGYSRHYVDIILWIFSRICVEKKACMHADTWVQSSAEAILNRQEVKSIQFFLTPLPDPYYILSLPHLSGKISWGLCLETEDEINKKYTHIRYIWPSAFGASKNVSLVSSPVQGVPAMKTSGGSSRVLLAPQDMRWMHPKDTDYPMDDPTYDDLPEDAVSFCSGSINELLDQVWEGGGESRPWKILSHFWES